MSNLTEVDKNNFEGEVRKSSLPVVVDIWSDKCGKCKEIVPFLEKLGEEYKGKLKIVKLNHLGNRRFTFQFRFKGLPTFLFFKNGEEVGKLTDNLDDSVEKIQEGLKKSIIKLLS
jgi:thioredoxin 1